MAAGNYTTTSNKPYEGEMKMADTREVFEAHFKLGIRQQKRYKDGDYRDTFVQDKWEGWQARERITAAPVQTPEQMAHMVETAPVDEPTDAERIMRAHVPARPILYTDTIYGEQCRRDDMWAVTTEELNRLAAPEPAGWRDFLVRLGDLEGSMVNGNRLSIAAKELLAAAKAENTII